MILDKIPTEQFDISRHVISCREQGTGRQVWVTLQSLSEAEQVYEGAPQAINANLGEYVTKGELELFRDVIVKAVADHVPPPSLSGEVTTVLADLSQLAVSQKQEIEELKAAMADMAHNFAILQDKWIKRGAE